MFFHRGKSSPADNQTHTEQFLGNPSTNGPDRVMLLDDPIEAGRLRLQLISEAKHTLDICYHTIVAGDYSDLFFAEILKAADRGVTVRILFEGKVGGMANSSTRPILDALLSHEHITVAKYEPLNILKPWTWNNILHDKYLIADETLVITGGRNIGDKLYHPAGYDGRLVHDLDVLIYRFSQNEGSLEAFSHYADSLWDLSFVKILSFSDLSARRQRAVDDTKTKLLERAAVIETQNPQFFSSWITSWEESTIATKKVTLIHNPLGRGSKAPKIWDELMSLCTLAQERIIIQSPYIVPLKNQIKDLEALSNVTYITNSSYATPNFFGYGGYLRKKTQVVATGDVIEYMGEGSVHSKSGVIDETLGIVGTFNLDPRSLHLDTETMIIIESEQFVDQLVDYYESLQAESAVYHQDGTVTPSEIHGIRQPGLGKRILLTFAAIITWPITLLV